MIRNVLSVALGSAAIALASPVIAGPGGGHGGGPGGGANISAGANMNAGAMGGPSQTGINAGVNAQGSINASPNSALNRNATTTTTTTTRAINSQGPFRASPTGIVHASPNSVLGRGAVSSITLPGLTTGLTVQTSTGTTLGNVSQIVTDTSGNIRLVIVTNATTGQTLRLAPNTLSISGGVVTTTGG